MSKEIDVTFFEPNEPSIIKKGRLIIDEYAKNLIEFKGNWVDPFRVIDIIFADAINSGEQYTLVNSVFNHSADSNYRFTVNELYQGAHLSKVTVENCLKATAHVTGLTGWINQPRIKASVSFDATEPGSVLIKPFYERLFSINDNISLRLEEYCYEQLSRDAIILENRSQYFVEVNRPVSRVMIQRLSFAFLKLLSIFTEYVPKLTGFEIELADGLKVSHLTFKPQGKPKNNDPLLSLDLMSDHFDNLLQIYYAQMNNYVKIIDLLNASIENRTLEISFLNLTAALEVFHKNFLEDGNNVLRNQIANDLEQAGLKNPGSNNWNQVMRYYHLFLYIDTVEFFPKMVTDYKKMADIIKDSRNYYTHYSETSKDVWTANQLLYANNLLRQLVKGIILKTLRLPDTLINRLVNNNFASISHRYDKNEYSMHFIDREL